MNHVLTVANAPLDLRDGSKNPGRAKVFDCTSEETKNLDQPLYRHCFNEELRAVKTRKELLKVICLQ